MEKGKEVWILWSLVWLAWRDIRNRRLPLQGLCLFLAAGLPFWIERALSQGIRAWATLLPGVLCAVVSFLSGQALGMGDVLVILAMGLYLSGDQFFLFLASGMLAGMVWAGQLWVRHRNGKEEFPFLPCLLAGYVGGLWIW